MFRFLQAKNFPAGLTEEVPVTILGATSEFYKKLKRSKLEYVSMLHQNMDSVTCPSCQHQDLAKEASHEESMLEPQTIS